VSITQELLTFGVGIDTSNAEAGLASLGSAADGVAVGLEDRLSGASDGLKDLGKQSGTASRGIQGLAAVVSLVDPRLGQVIRSVGTLARGLSVLRLGLGPAALAVGALTAGLALYQREQQRAADAMAAAQTRADNLSDALERVADSARDIEDQIRMVNGEIDSFGLAAETQADQARAASDAVVGAYDAQIEASRALVDQLATEDSKQQHLLTLRRGNEQRAEAAADALALERANLQRLTEARSQEIDRVERQVEVIDLLAEFHRESRDAQEREAEAREASAAAQRAAAAADRERIASLAELERLMDEVASIREQAAGDQVSENQRILDSYDAQLERLAEIQRVTGQSADIDAARAEVIAAREQAEFDMFLEHQAEKARLEEEQHQRALEIIETERQARMQAQQDISSSLASFGQLSMQIAKKRSETDARAAQRALDMSKRLGFAQIAIDTAIGVQKALSQSAGNPILAALGIASVIAGAATQTAAVASQSLHQGGQLAPDEQSVRTVVLRDERIDETGRVMSPEASRRLERGESAGRAQVVPVPQYQHFGVFFADVVESGGTPMHDLIYQGRDVGRAGY
jgi:hypothetical protein